MTKNQLRTYYKKLRTKLSEQEKEEKSLAIANMLVQTEIWDNTFYHLFLPITEQNEVNTEYILNLLMGKDKEIVLSKTDFLNHQMTHFLLTEETKIKKNSYNIPEPVSGEQISVEKIDVVFIPLLAYDRNGNRVGYGKGFYDKFLSECRENVVKVGLSFFNPENEIEDVYEDDIPLDYCITPDTIYRFKKNK
jgi:5-formyltetrahydrofolate cyclo-ligase